MKKLYLSSCLLFLLGNLVYAQNATLQFGKVRSWDAVISGSDQTDSPIQWMNVNTDDDTWKVQGDILMCTGLPIGVMRSRIQFENFMMHVEWKHLEAGGNSGIFV